MYKTDSMSEEAYFYTHDYEGVEPGVFGATAGFAFQLCSFLAVWPWENGSISLCAIFLIVKYKE